MDVKILSEDEQEIEMREMDDEDDAASDKLSLNLEGTEVGAE
jgi:DNA-directed RNA polymerase subunit beta